VININNKKHLKFKSRYKLLHISKKFSVNHIWCNNIIFTIFIGYQYLQTFLEVTLEIATYNWPYENIGVERYTPTCLSDYPWLLLMVIATLILIENSSLTSQFSLPLFHISLYHDSVSLFDFIFFPFFSSFSSFFLYSISWSFVFLPLFIHYFPFLHISKYLFLES